VDYYERQSAAYKKAPRLSAPEERDLLHRWQTRQDQTARSKLAEANMYIVGSHARMIQRYCSLPYEDLLAEGSLGLLAAMDKFDLRQPVRFVTYAVYWVRVYMQKATTQEWRRGKTGTAMTPSVFCQIHRIRARHIARYGSEDVRIERMAEDIGLPVRKLKPKLALLNAPDLSLDTPTNEDQPPLLDQQATNRPSPYAEIEAEDTCKRMQQCLRQTAQSLTHAERAVLQLRLLQPDAPSAAGAATALKVSRQRVSQIEAVVKRKLKARLPQEALKLVS